MNQLEAVIQRAKRDIAHKYVYVMMPIPQLQVLIDGLEEAQRENERMYTTNNSLQARYNVRGERIEELELELKILKEDRMAAIKDLESLQREIDEKDDAISYAMNQIQIKESHIRKMEAIHAAS